MTAKIFIIVNEDRFFLSHRKNIGLEAKMQGYDVTIVCKDTGRKKEISDMGISVIELPINPTGKNIVQEFMTLHFLIELYKEERPDIIHHVGLKNILWGGLAAKLVHAKGVVNAVSGLGVMFSGGKVSFLNRCILKIMAFSNHGMNVCEIFQNNEDKSLFLENRVIDEKRCAFIKGSGVDLNEYHMTDETSEGKMKVLFAARMVKEKGTLTLIRAAERLRKDFEEKVEFLLCGPLSNNPNGMQKEELESHCDGSYILWLGQRSDVVELLRQTHIVALPSYYREGVPRSLIEACASGKPIVTCNSIGSKDTVDDGVNGFLIAPEDDKTLADRLRTLLTDKELRTRMGKAGREKAEREFSVTTVVDKHMAIYDKLINGKYAEL